MKTLKITAMATAVLIASSASQVATAEGSV